MLLLNLQLFPKAKGNLPKHKGRLPGCSQNWSKGRICFRKGFWLPKKYSYHPFLTTSTVQSKPPYAHEEGKASVLIVNKWDLIEKDTHTIEKFKKSMLADLAFMSYVPMA